MAAELSRPVTAASGQWRAVTRPAAEVDDAGRRFDRDARCEIDRGLSALAGELQVLGTVPTWHGNEKR